MLVYGIPPFHRIQCFCHVSSIFSGSQAFYLCPISIWPKSHTCIQHPSNRTIAWQGKQLIHTWEKSPAPDPWNTQAPRLLHKASPPPHPLHMPTHPKEHTGQHWQFVLLTTAHPGCIKNSQTSMLNLTLTTINKFGLYIACSYSAKQWHKGIRSDHE